MKDDATRVIAYQRVCMILRFGCHTNARAIHPILIIHIDKNLYFLLITLTMDLALFINRRAYYTTFYLKGDTAHGTVNNDAVPLFDIKDIHMDQQNKQMVWAHYLSFTVIILESL